MKQSAIIILAATLATANAYALPGCLLGCGGESKTEVKSGPSGGITGNKGGKAGLNKTGKGGDVKKGDNIGPQRAQTAQTNKQKTGSTTSNSGMNMSGANIGTGNTQGGNVNFGSINTASAPNILPKGPTMKTGPNGVVEVTGGYFEAGPPQPAPVFNINNSVTGNQVSGITNSGNGGATGGSNENKNTAQQKGSTTGGAGPGGASGAATGANGGASYAKTGDTGNGPVQGGKGGDGKFDFTFAPTVAVRRSILLRRQIAHSRRAAAAAIADPDIYDSGLYARDADAEAFAEPDIDEYLDNLYARALTMRYMMMTS